MKTLPYAVFLLVIYEIQFPITRPMNLWRFGPMTIAVIFYFQESWIPPGVNPNQTGNSIVLTLSD
jgi:hypothetical protein